jgi:hypothetical protein
VYAAQDVNDITGTINLLTSTTLSSSAGKNALINGGFDVWQRGTSFAVTSTAYTADRWQGYRFVAGATISRQVTNDTTNLPNIQYCARVQRNAGNTATDQIWLSQSFETVNTIPFVGKTITLSYYARAGANYSAASNAMSVLLFTGTGTDQSINSGYTGSAATLNVSSTLTTTWQRFSQLITIPTTATELAVQFRHTGPTGTAGANDYFEVTGVQLELGSVATSFARNASTFQGELAACQRYYQRINTVGYQRYVIGQCNATTQALYYIPFSQQMRVNPTSVETTGTASNYATTSNTGGVVAATLVPTINDSTPNGVTVYVNVASGLTAGNATQLFSNNATTYIGWSAEL